MPECKRSERMRSVRNLNGRMEGFTKESTTNRGEKGDEKIFTRELKTELINLNLLKQDD